MAESLKRKLVWISVIAASGLAVAVGGVMNDPPAPDPVAQATATAVNEVAMLVRHIRSGTKNPKSFELVQAARAADGAICAVYRGTNSFNAVVTERALVLAGSREVLTPANTRSFDVSWTSTCAAPASDVTRLVRRVL